MVVKPYLNANGDLPAYLLEPNLERTVEAGAEHSEQGSHLTLAPTAIRDLLQKISQKVGHPEAPVVAVVSSSSRPFLRQIVEPTIRNLFFISHNEIPMEVKVQSLGVIQ
jgi:flagellar biosynthesis component FlhA